MKRPVDEALTGGEALKRAALVGSQGMYLADGLRFLVQIRDVKEAYGTLRVLITPIGGSGSRWVYFDSVDLAGGVHGKESGRG